MDTETLRCPTDGHQCGRAGCLENPPDPECTQTARQLVAMAAITASIKERLFPEEKNDLTTQQAFYTLSADQVKIAAKKLGVNLELFINHIERLAEDGFTYTVDIEE